LPTDRIIVPEGFIVPPAPDEDVIEQLIWIADDGLNEATIPKITRSTSAALKFAFFTFPPPRRDYSLSRKALRYLAWLKEAWVFTTFLHSFNRIRSL
jgi:hypothetical protein